MTSNFRAHVVPIAALCALLLTAITPVAQTSEDYAQAETLIRQGQLDQGIAVISRILAHEPKDPQAHNLLGIALTGKGDLLAANQEYRKALQSKPDFVPALKNLAINEVTANEVASAVNHFTAALKLTPQDPVIHAYLGKIAYSRKDYRTAASHLSKTGDLVTDPSVASELIESELQLGQPQQARDVLSRLDPSKLASQWQFPLGLALAQHELFQEAIPFLQNASAQAPDSYDAVFDLAVCYVETKQFTQAIEVLRRIADQGHKTAELNNLLAEAYEGNQQTQEAINALREAAQLAPEDENSYVHLTALCAKYDAYDLGLEIIQAGLRYHPQSDRLIFQRGVIHAMRSQFDLAEQDFQRAAQLAPEKNLSHAALGISYMQTGNLPQAITSLRQRTQERPDDFSLQFLLGEALIRSGAAPGVPAFAEAKRALEKSVKLNPKSPDSQVDLGKICLQENRLDEAVRYLEQARALDPKNKAAYSQLAIAYRRQGKTELASAMLATLNQLNDEQRKGEPRQRRLRVAKDDSPAR